MQILHSVAHPFLTDLVVKVRMETGYRSGHALRLRQRIPERITAAEFATRKLV